MSESDAILTCQKIYLWKNAYYLVAYLVLISDSYTCPIEFVHLENMMSIHLYVMTPLFDCGLIGHQAAGKAIFSLKCLPQVMPVLSGVLVVVLACPVLSFLVWRFFALIHPSSVRILRIINDWRCTPWRLYISELYIMKPLKSSTTFTWFHKNIEWSTESVSILPHHIQPLCANSMWDIVEDHRFTY